MQPRAKNESQSTAPNDPETSEQLFVRQVEDRALTALQIFTEQRTATESDVAIRVYIP